MMIDVKAFRMELSVIKCLSILLVINDFKIPFDTINIWMIYGISNLSTERPTETVWGLQGLRR